MVVHVHTFGSAHPFVISYGIKMSLTAGKVYSDCMFYARQAPLRIQSFLAMILPDFGAPSLFFPLEYTLHTQWRLGRSLSASLNI